jgi:hypothetical protein
MTDPNTAPEPEDTGGQVATPATASGQSPDPAKAERDDTEGHIKTRSTGLVEDDFDVSEGSRRRI